MHTATPKFLQESEKVADTHNVARQRHDLSGPTMIDVDRRQRRVPSALPPPAAAASQDDVVLVATRLATVEQQLTSFFSSIATQANATRLAAESARHDARADLEELAASVRDAIERLTTQSAEDRRALRIALDARLADLASHQDWRFAEIEARLDRVADDASNSATAGVATGAVIAAGAGVASHDVDQRITEILGPVAARLESLGAEVAHASQQITRLDSNGAALHQFVSQMQGAVEARSTEVIDAKLAELRNQIGASLTALRGEVDGSLTQVRTAVVDHVGHSLGVLRDEIDVAVTERFTDVDTQVAALRNGVDQTLAAVSARVTDIESTQADSSDRLVRVEQATSKVDHKEIEHLREKMQTAVGEAVLMRIEMDRLSSSLDERFDSVRVRLSEVEAQMSDNMDVSTAVQLERLEELERAVMFLSPGDSPSAQALAHAQNARVPAAPVPQAPAARPVSTPVPPPPGATTSTPAPPPAPPQAAAPVHTPTPPPPPTIATAPTPTAPAMPTASAMPTPVMATPVSADVPPPPPGAGASVPPPPPAPATVPSIHIDDQGLVATNW